MIIMKMVLLSSNLLFESVSSIISNNMSVETGTQNFADAIRAKLQTEKEENIKHLESILPNAERIYDENMLVAERLNIIESFRSAAIAHRDITKKKARVVISERPRIDYNMEFDPTQLDIEGHPQLSVQLIWEPVRSKGLEYSIEVSIWGDTLIIFSGKEEAESFSVSHLDMDKLNGLLIEAYSNPRTPFEETDSCII